MKQTQLFYRMDPLSIPWNKSDPGYSTFWENEKSKVERGIEIDGYRLSGWLYWHINHWKINADVMTDYGEIIPDMITPSLRDNEIILNEELKLAEKDKKGIVIMGLRQFSKTTMESSYAARAGILFKGSQNLIMGTSSDDLNNLTQNLDYGLLNCSSYFRIPRITKDWGQERVLVGLKTKSGDNIVHSTYVIRNTIGGKNTEKGAGVSNLKSNIWDEIGKNDFLQALIGTKPAMLSAHGWRCIPICVGTGGNVEKAQDAKKLFFNPKAHTFIEHLQDDGRTTGLFLPGWLRQDCKYKTSLAQYLINENILLNIPKDSELWDIDINVADKEKATKKIESELEEFLKEGDLESYNRWKAYYPLNVDDVFLSESNNNFPVDACKAQKKWLESGTYTPEYIDLYRDPKGKIDFTYSDNKPINQFPVNAKDLKSFGKIPCSVFEHPDKEAPIPTYCIGIDPYNENESSDKINSLGSICVYKRYYRPGDPFANRIVFSWAGRCRTVVEFHELCLMVMEYYNAIEGTLPENEDKTMIQYVQMKKKGHYFAKALDLSKQINQTTKSNRNIGLSAATPNQKHYMSLLVEDAKEEISTIDESGNIEEYIGVSKILDPMLLEEYIQYKGKTSASKGIHDGNYDRCFKEGHLVQTSESLIDISNIKIGDKVLTHNNSFENVYELFKNNFEGELIKIKPLGNDKFIECTPNHPFLVGRYSKKPQGKNWYNRKENLDKIDWVLAKDIKKGDFLNIPKRTNRTPRELEDDALYLLGWYLSDGNVTKKNLRICFQGDQLLMAEKCKQILQKYDKFLPTYFNVKHYKSGKIFKSHTKKKTEPTITKIKNKYAFVLDCCSDWFISILDKYVTILPGGEKILKPSLYNQENLIPLILGFFEGDGHQATNTFYKNERHSLQLSGTYQIMVRQFRDIILNEGIWCTISPTLAKNENSKDQLRIDIQDYEGINRIVENSLKFKKIDILKKQRKSYLIKESGFWIPVATIEKEYYLGNVYNIEVEKDHSYTVDGISTHNCIAYGHALTLAKYYDVLYPLEGYKPKPTEPPKPEVRVKTFFGDIIPKKKSPFRAETQRSPKSKINW